jgi:hypothetical protein
MLIAFPQTNNGKTVEENQEQPPPQTQGPSPPASPSAQDDKRKNFSTGTLPLTKIQIRRSTESVVIVEPDRNGTAQRTQSTRAFHIARNRQERRCHTPSASADSLGVALPGLAPNQSHEHTCV